MIYLGYIILLTGLLRMLVALFNLVSKPYLPTSVPGSAQPAPLVSILIPARNEEHNIAQLLQDIAQLPYPRYEVLVYNDGSTDRTAQRVAEAAQQHPYLRLIEGEPLPTGWLGKNHACYQLAQHAQGKYLLFVDADIRMQGSLIEGLLHAAATQHSKLVSVFPWQITNKIGTQCAVPLMNWILLTLLPLCMVRWSGWVSFSAANGQCMCFDAYTYHQLQPHRQHKANKVEDIAICRYYKQQGYQVSTLLGDGRIQCRMYTSLAQSVEGFSKNIFAFFGGSKLVTLLFAVLTTLAPVVVWYTLGVYWAVGYVALGVLIRVIVARASLQPVGRAMLYALPQQVVLWLIIVSAWHRHSRSNLQWKGRNVLTP